MLFTSFEFALFLPVTLALFYWVGTAQRRYVLFIASLVFYMAWNPGYVVVLVTLITIDYVAAQWIARTSGRSRRAALLVSLCANGGLLVWFKYANFLRDTWTQVVAGGPAVQPLDIILPLGISFHTFQSISYVVDVYRGEQEAIESYVDYGLFVAFFPQLVAGPIVRAQEFFRDFYCWRPPTVVEWQAGVVGILTGLTKKLVFADQFALAADRYYNDPVAFSGFLPAWTGTLAFGLQIFFDFSGYTDIAIGVALLFGFHFPENFRRPYLSASVTEFWRRWHMTLSSWLRDYVYISLGGNRRGPRRTWLNLELTMLFGGLWHGADWTFVVWGAYHGLLLAAERIVDRGRAVTGLARGPRTVLTFLAVMVGWVFFRSRGIHDVSVVLRQMVSPFSGASMLGPAQWGLAGVALAAAILEEYAGALGQISRGPLWARTAFCVTLLLGMEFFSAAEEAMPFVYFQF
jgi:alginate O-acetyltransferase complex protein AlgI